MTRLLDAAFTRADWQSTLPSVDDWPASRVANRSSAAPLAPPVVLRAGECSHAAASKPGRPASWLGAALRRVRRRDRGPYRGARRERPARGSGRRRARAVAQPRLRPGRIPSKPCSSVICRPTRDGPADIFARPSACASPSHPRCWSNTATLRDRNVPGVGGDESRIGHDSQGAVPPARSGRRTRRLRRTRRVPGLRLR